MHGSTARSGLPAGARCEAMRRSAPFPRCRYRARQPSEEPRMPKPNLVEAQGIHATAPPAATCSGGVRSSRRRSFDPARCSSRSGLAFALRPRDRHRGKTLSHTGLPPRTSGLPARNDLGRKPKTDELPRTAGSRASPFFTTARESISSVSAGRSLYSDAFTTCASTRARSESKVRRETGFLTVTGDARAKSML